jgi:hypothetical protein
MPRTTVRYKKLNDKIKNVIVKGNSYTQYPLDSQT